MFDIQTEAFLRHAHSPQQRRAARDHDASPVVPVLIALSLAMWCGVLFAAL